MFFSLLKFVSLQDKAVAAYAKATEKAVGIGGKIDVIFTQIRMGFFWNDLDMVKRNIEIANKYVSCCREKELFIHVFLFRLVEQGGDWDRRNKLKIYEGTYFMYQRDFKQAAQKFLDTIATFTSTEMFAYNTFVFYTVVISVFALDRVALREKVVRAPEILSAIDELPDVRELLNSLYNGHYAKFLRALVEVTTMLQRDWMLAVHAQYWNREMRIRAYSQFLESYRSVTLASMAKTFGISEKFLDEYVLLLLFVSDGDYSELSRFIAAGRINCKIDKVAGIIETTRPDTRNAQYLDTIKQGDLLLTRIQKLSRVINV